MNAASFLVVPQWQGSGSSRAMRLVDGTAAIHGDLPTARTHLVDVPLEAGDEQGSGVARCSSLLIVRERMAQQLGEVTGPAITIGGDCGVELGAIERTLDEDVAIVWFDAHPDLNTPESSVSSAFHGMVLRTLLGDGHPDLVPLRPLSPSRVVLAGARAFDPAEDEYIERVGIRCLEVADLTPQSLVAAVEGTGATAVYLHIDLDVLDPGDFIGLGYPEPFGLAAQELVDLVKALKSRFSFAGAGITEFAPSSMEESVNDLPTILRIIAALAA